MSEFKKYVVSIFISDPLNPNLSINTENYISNILNEEYVGKCYNGAFILKIEEIIEISDCEIIMTNLSGTGNINVKFIAAVKQFYSGDFLFNVHIQKTQPSILGRYTEETKDGDITAYIMIPYGIQFEPSPLKKSVMSIREYQRIPMRIIDVYHKCKNSIPAIGATLLVCEKKYNKYIITSNISKKLIFSIILKKIKDEMDLRINLSVGVKKNILFFENLLYSYKMDKIDNAIIESDNFPEWHGLQSIDYNKEDDGDVINLLDFLINGEFDDSNIIGIWSRPLYIYKSSPIAIFKKISVEELSKLKHDDPTLLEEGCPEAVFIRFLKDILSYLTIIRQMAEYYVDNATVMANKNIWDAMRDVQLLSI
jgi:hypothetical protein